MLFSVTFSLIFCSCRNLVTSRSLWCSLTCRNAFSIFAMIPVLFILSLRSKPHRSSKITGPRSRHSLRLFIFFLFLHVRRTRLELSTFFRRSNSVVWYIVFPVTIFLLNLFIDSFVQPIFYNFVKISHLCFKSTKRKFVVFRQVMFLSSLWPTDLISSIFFGDCVFEHLHYQIVSFLISLWFYSNRL